ncbi:MAG: hypothetical protein QOD75_1575 [Blastocatellia bacterium]|jgi:predicted short-subunit dehydrogenase-like oxidoreductase (DUF2520 family)|nr:hypothetical protein [Blastocatellia bacterium]
MRHRKKKSSALDPHRSENKPNIAIIGAGRLGTTLGRALAAAGYRVKIVVAQHVTHARRSAKLIGGSARPVAASNLQELEFSELVLITTPDNEIARVALSLSQSNKRASKSGVVLHASGALTSAALQPLKRIGWAVGSMHPLVSISDPATDPSIFRGAFFCVEGDRKAATQARQLAGALGGQSFSLSAAVKPLYHAAGVMSSGHVVALFDIAIQMLKECGLSERRARAVLLPLLQSTVTSLASSTPAQALTGPFARGDFDTIKTHLEVMKSHRLKEVLAAYKLLSKRSLELAATHGLPPAAALKIRREIDST